jgi:uncharacterized protein (TIGR02118 family)
VCLGRPCSPRMRHPDRKRDRLGRAPPPYRSPTRGKCRWRCSRPKASRVISCARSTGPPQPARRAPTAPWLSTSRRVSGSSSLDGNGDCYDSTKTRDEFQRYWRDEHAPLVERHAEVLRIRRYVQTHARDTDADDAISGARGSEPGQYDGVAELWWDSVDDLLAASASEEGQVAAAGLLEDERLFIDLPNSPIWLGEENVVIDQG